ncbi:MAG: hypothetical protein AAB606_05390 [Patescibacteria group bacterium]
MPDNPTEKIPSKPFIFPEEEPIEMPTPQEYDSPLEDEEVKSAVKKSFVIVVVIAILLFVVGNTVWNLSWNKKKAVQPGGDITVIDTPVDPNLILAATGGTVSLGKAELIIPPGALARDERIEIEKVADGEVTDLYYFKPHGLKFLKRITVVLPYKEEGLKGQSPYSIELDYWPKEKVGDPRAIGYSINEQEKTLQTHVSEF